VKTTPSPRCNLATSAPSPWIKRWLPSASQGKTLLDWACGSGRHSLYAYELGYEVTAFDLNMDDLCARYPGINWQKIDLENGELPLPLSTRFDVIVVTNYLFRSRLNFLLQHLAPNGLLLYETFAIGNEVFGRPKNPEFLLQAGELYTICKQHQLHVLGFEDGVTESPARIQRVAARALPPCDMAVSGADYLLLK
jgi:SAM-dependent methyltransferase